MEVTRGHLLGGLVAYTQPVDGYRTGIEPVLLAASVPARPGERVLEGGTGSGAGLLCLAARVPGIAGVGVELVPEMAELARRNLRDNGLSSVEIVTGDVTRFSSCQVRHAFANPPWHDPRSTLPRLARRRLATHRVAGAPAAWVAAMAARLEDAGTLTMIVPADAETKLRTALLAAGLGGVAVLRLRPKAGRPPKLAVVQGRRGPAPPSGEMVLHRPDGGFSDEAERVLRQGGATELATISAS